MSGVTNRSVELPRKHHKMREWLVKACPASGINPRQCLTPPRTGSLAFFNVLNFHSREVYLRDFIACARHRTATVETPTVWVGNHFPYRPAGDALSRGQK